MHRTLVSAVLAGLIASAHAHPKTAPSIIKPDAVIVAVVMTTVLGDRDLAVIALELAEAPATARHP